MQAEYKIFSYKDLRKFNYDYQAEDILKSAGIDITSFIKNPYTYLKSKYFLELSTLIVYFLKKTSISPNIVSLFSSLSAIIGGLLILSPNLYALVFGLFFFFNGYVFDWCDGLLARVTGQSSLTGSILDPWSTHFFALAFKLFIGLYVATYTSSLFFYLVPFVVFFTAVDIKTYFQSTMFVDLTEKNLKIRDDIIEVVHDDEVKLDGVKNFVGKNLKYMLFLSAFPDDRARTIDLICLLIIIEQYFNVNIIWLIFVLMVLKELIRFLIHVLFVIRSGWVEGKVTLND